MNPQAHVICIQISVVPIVDDRLIVCLKKASRGTTISFQLKQ